MRDEQTQILGEQAYAKAMQYELDYGCCPHCVLAAVQETVGIVDDQTVKAFDDARGKQCAHATGTVTRWVIEML